MGINNCPDLKTSFRNGPNYHVLTWEGDENLECPEAPDGPDAIDLQISAEWKAGVFDRERGATFIGLDVGREWIVWMEDRTVGYNLSKGAFIKGTPSEFFFALRAKRPDKLFGIEKLLVTLPTASKSLHALRNIAPEAAHRLLANHCKARGQFVDDMNFDEFAQFVQSRYPNMVVARYDIALTDLTALGAIIDAFEGNLFLVNPDDDKLQDSFSRCF